MKLEDVRMGTLHPGVSMRVCEDSVGLFWGATLGPGIRYRKLASPRLPSRVEAEEIAAQCSNSDEFLDALYVLNRLGVRGRE